jgi:LysR family transcriptional regulator, benzoate and cis,cis-muconate-responsive activator of ben and cat genes
VALGSRRLVGTIIAMELRQLRYFLAVAEEGRFSRAAARLHLAAPSLSQQIRVLERELRVTLFHRTARGVVLTPAGEVLLPRARVILAEADRAREDVRAAGAARREPVSLRVCTMAELVLDGPLRDAALGILGVEVFATPCPGDDAIEAVRQARADAAIVWSRSPDQRDLDGVVLGAVVFGVVLPQGHPLAGAQQVPVALLSGETVVMPPRPQFAGVWDGMVSHLLPGGATVGQVIVEPNQLNAPEAVLRAVAAGAGIAAGILGIADHRGIEGIVVRPLDPALRLELEAVWRAPGRPAVGLLAAFLVDSSRDSRTVIEPPGRAGKAPVRA